MASKRTHPPATTARKIRGSEAQRTRLAVPHATTSAPGATSFAEHERWRILVGDCRSVLRTLPSESVQCVVTSPPYFGLRDYEAAGQVGLEPTPALFVEAMVEIFRELRRVLRRDGTVWLNLGDVYANNGSRGPSGPNSTLTGGQLCQAASRAAQRMCEAARRCVLTGGCTSGAAVTESRKIAVGDVVRVVKQPPRMHFDMTGMVGFVDELQVATDGGRYVYFVTLDLDDTREGGRGSIPLECVAVETRPEWLEAKRRYDARVDQNFAESMAYGDRHAAMVAKLAAQYGITPAAARAIHHAIGAFEDTERDRVAARGERETREARAREAQRRSR